MVILRIFFRIALMSSIGIMGACVTEVPAIEAKPDELVLMKEGGSQKDAATKELGVSSIYKAPTKEDTLSADMGPKTGSSYKKGSQGAVKPARTGNEDDDVDEKNLMRKLDLPCDKECADCENDCNE